MRVTPRSRNRPGRWRSFVALAVPLAVLGAPGPAPAGAGAGAAGQPPVVEVQAPVGIAAEGGPPATFRISRDVTDGDLLVNLSLSGSADAEMDYLLRGADETDGAHVTVTIRDGHEFVDLLLEAVDDVPAEADESVVLALVAGSTYTIRPAAARAVVIIPKNDFAVTTTRDGGEGSLRQAILNAIDLDGPHTVTFDTTVGPFAAPQTIVLTATLPDLKGNLTIDGSIAGVLWQVTGVTVSGDNRRRVFTVAAGARVVLRSLTVANGLAKDGGGVSNAGELIVNSVTFLHDVARRDGGGLANTGGRVTAINSTFVENRARRAGGGLADRSGTATVTNCTFSDNAAKLGGGLFSDGRLLLRNTILANSLGPSDCVCSGTLDPAGTHNLIEAGAGCGEPISAADPRLEKLGAYNGPVSTMPLSEGSPAINLGDNASALDEDGKPLEWDQRGNGDPRFVAGFTDIGAFETQSWPLLQVDTAQDSELRACTEAATGDCSLRGAIELANATREPDVITFDPRVFNEPRIITLTRPLPDLATDMTIDASAAAGVRVRTPAHFTIFNVLPGAKVRFVKILWDDARTPPEGQTPAHPRGPDDPKR